MNPLRTSDLVYIELEKMQCCMIADELEDEMYLDAPLAAGITIIMLRKHMMVQLVILLIMLWYLFMVQMIFLLLRI